MKRNIKPPEGEIFYALATLPLRKEPSASSKVVGHLALHETVTRIRIERGFSFVAVGEFGLEGWVESAKIARRIPAAGSAPETPTRTTGEGSGGAGNR